MVRAELSRDAIVACAMDIADVAGLEAITIRRISKEFGVTPMALYWHFQSKDELLEAMGDSLYAGISSDVDPGIDWPDQLRVLMTRLLDALRRHPGGVPLAYARVLMSEPGLRLSEAVFAILERAGFDDRAAANLGATALRTAVALVGDEPGRTFGGSAQERDTLHARKHERLAALPEDEFPMVRRLGTLLLDCDCDDYYAFGIDHYVGGVAQLAQAQHTARTPPTRRRAQSRS